MELLPNPIRGEPQPPASMEGWTWWWINRRLGGHIEDKTFPIGEAAALKQFQ